MLRAVVGMGKEALCIIQLQSSTLEQCQQKLAVAYKDSEFILPPPTLKIQKLTGSERGEKRICDPLMKNN